MRRTCVALLALAYAVGTPPSARAAGVIDLPVLRSYVEVQAVHLSPDGKRLLIRVQRQNFDANRYEEQLIGVDLTTRRSAQVTPPLEGLGAARWSPDGASIAYIADAGSRTGNVSEVFLVPARGGTPRQLTHAPRGIYSFSWRPDGGAIAYESDDAAPDAKQIQAGLDAFEVGNQDYLSTSKPTSAHLWLQSVAGGAPRRLTSGTWSLAKGELIFPLPEVAPVPFFDWSPDGRSIVFARMNTPYKADTVGSVTDVLDVRTGALRKLTSHERLEAGGVYSPDGKHIAYVYPRDGNPLAEAEMMVTSSTGGDGVDATRAHDLDALGAIWLRSDTLLIAAFMDTRSRLFTVDLRGHSKQLATGDVDPVPGVLDANSHGIAFAGSEPGRATEAYYMSSSSALPVRLTNYNAAIDERAQSRVEGIRWQGPDGYAGTGVLYYPPGFTRTKKYPLVLQIHGGPTETSIASWRDTDWPGLPQYIASRGYVVFSPNYRGSDSNGNAYQLAIFNDAGDGPGRDVMAGVEAVKKLGFVDENKMAVSGWSYGGFMTEWLITHYDVWKAAVAGAAPSDLFLDYSTSDYNAMGTFYFGGSPWDSPALMQAYRDQSPLTYAAQVKAPTLIMSDQYDVRVPAIHSYEFYHALRENHVPVSFVVYPVAEHWPADPVRSEDIYRRWVAWLDRYLR